MIFPISYLAYPHFKCCNTNTEILECIFTILMFLQFGQSFGFCPNLLQVLQNLSSFFPHAHFSVWLPEHVWMGMSGIPIIFPIISLLNITFYLSFKAKLNIVSFMKFSLTLPTRINLYSELLQKFTFHFMALIFFYLVIISVFFLFSFLIVDMDLASRKQLDLLHFYYAQHRTLHFLLFKNIG